MRGGGLRCSSSPATPVAKLLVLGQAFARRERSPENRPAVASGSRAGRQRRRRVILGRDVVPCRRQRSGPSDPGMHIGRLFGAVTPVFPPSPPYSGASTCLPCIASNSKRQSNPRLSDLATIRRYTVCCAWYELRQLSLSGPACTATYSRRRGLDCGATVAKAVASVAGRERCPLFLVPPDPGCGRARYGFCPGDCKSDFSLTRFVQNRN